MTGEEVGVKQNRGEAGPPLFLLLQGTMCQSCMSLGFIIIALIKDSFGCSSQYVIIHSEIKKLFPQAFFKLSSSKRKVQSFSLGLLYEFSARDLKADFKALNITVFTNKI